MVPENDIDCHNTSHNVEAAKMTLNFDLTLKCQDVSLCSTPTPLQFFKTCLNVTCLNECYMLGILPINHNISFLVVSTNQEIPILL